MSSLNTQIVLSIVGRKKDIRDHGDIHLIMKKNTTVLTIQCHILCYIESTQDTCQYSLVVLALHDCISFGLKTHDGELIIDDVSMNEQVHWRVNVKSFEQCGRLTLNHIMYFILFYFTS